MEFLLSWIFNADSREKKQKTRSFLPRVFLF